MKKIKDFIWRLLYDDLAYLILNSVVNDIPFWSIRKLCYKIGGMKIGTGSRIMMHCIVMRPSKITIGDNNVINQYALLDGRSGLVIGNNNSISMFAKLYSGTHKSYSNTFEYLGKDTRMKDNCWIGTSAVIMPGSYLEDFTIISVNSVFKGKSQEKGIYMGIPAKLVKEREINEKYEIDYHSWFN